MRCGEGLWQLAERRSRRLGTGQADLLMRLLAVHMTPDQSQASARPTAYKATFSSHGTKTSNTGISMDWKADSAGFCSGLGSSRDSRCGVTPEPAVLFRFWLGAL
jgi:hypothetical protein